MALAKESTKCFCLIENYHLHYEVEENREAATVTVCKFNELKR